MNELEGSQSLQALVISFLIELAEEEIRGVFGVDVEGMSFFLGLV